MKKVKALIFTALLAVGFTSVAGAASSSAEAASDGVITVNTKPVCTTPCKKEM
ncbi:hypothetical protein [Lysinibacillus xylanilyticus]|uniref:hypothetical protein n=1 Tax=Lysinibacillus xylanilyticus TaxID=582475 RepID=UPI000AEE1D1E|nr:hypothetical protein [Lysinibacillus xylanilyticus]